MLYNNTVTKQTLATIKGWGETVEAVRAADLTKIKDPRARLDMAAKKQFLDSIDARTLTQTLSKFYDGALALARVQGKDPTTVKDPGAHFLVTDGTKQGWAKLPPEWERSLTSMYLAGLEQFPKFGKNTVANLDKLMRDNPIDPTKKDDKFTTLDPKEADKFLNEMKACKVPVDLKTSPDKDSLTKQLQLGTESADTLRSQYGKLPDLAGAEGDAEVKLASSEYGPAPTLTKGKPGSNDDDDGDAVN